MMYMRMSEGHKSKFYLLMRISGIEEEEGAHER